MEEPAAFDVPEPEEDSGDVPAYRSPPKPPMKGSRGGAQRAASMRTKTIYEWTFRKPDLNLTVGFDRERSGSIFCRVSLKDARQRPVPGSPVTLIGQSSKPFRLRTNGEGIVELPVFDPGEYTLALEYPRRLRLRIEIL